MSVGLVGLLWSIYWCSFSAERPAVHRTISESERIYIEESLGESCSILTKVKCFRESEESTA